MGRSLSRRLLFRHGADLDIRPPGATSERRFIEVCDRCGDCRRACPTGVIVAGDGGFPAMNFRRGECTFCGRCIEACRPEALASCDGEIGLPLSAAVRQGCLSASGVICRICGEHCETSAIHFRLQLGGRALPEIDAQKCNGCGACVAPCPVGAVVIKPRQEMTQCA